MKLPPRTRDWGPGSPLEELWERQRYEEERQMLRDLSVHLYGRQYIVLPYRLPTYQLRKRTQYGGKKGRRAAQRLKARGCKPVVERFAIRLA